MMRLVAWLSALVVSGMLKYSSVFAFSPSPTRTLFQPQSQHGVLSERSFLVPTLGSTVQEEDVDAEAADDVAAPRIPRGVHAPVVEIHSPQELADFLNEDDRICIIKFHATWCKSCQRMGMKFQSFANKHGDWIQGQARYQNDDEDYNEREVFKVGDYRFGSIEIGANSGMCKHMKIKTLPSIHLYAGGEQLAGFPCGPTRFYRLQEQLEYQEKQLSPSSSEPSSFAVAPISTPMIFTPELPQQMIALDASGELKSRRTCKL